MDPKDYIGKRYKSGDGYMTVIGYISSPAIILMNPATREQSTVVIGCRNHELMEEISDSEALTILENEVFRNHGTDTP